MGSIEIRHIRGRESSQVTAIARDSFEKPWTEDEFRQFLDSPSSVSIAAFDSTGAMGAYFIGLVSLSEVDTISIAVSPNRRRSGIGKLLVSWVQNLKFVQSMRLEVDVLNVSAIALYKSCGFEVLNIRKKYYENKRDAYLMGWERIEGKGTS